MLTLGMKFEIVNFKFYRQQFCKVLQKKFNFTCNEPILLDVEAWLNDFTPSSYRAHSATYMFSSLKDCARKKRDWNLYGRFPFLIFFAAFQLEIDHSNNVWVDNNTA